MSHLWSFGHLSVIFRSSFHNFSHLPFPHLPSLTSRPRLRRYGSRMSQLHLAPRSQVLPGLARSCQVLPGLARSCQVLPGAACIAVSTPLAPRKFQDFQAPAQRHHMKQRHVITHGITWHHMASHGITWQYRHRFCAASSRSVLMFCSSLFFEPFPWTDSLAL